MFKTFTTFLLEESNFWGLDPTSELCQYDPNTGPAYYPFSATIMKRLNRILQSQIAYHVCNLEGLYNLVKIQQTKKTISAFTEITKKSLLYIIEKGVAHAGGILVKLQGDILFSRGFDFASRIDARNKSRRWVSAKFLFGSGDSSVARKEWKKWKPIVDKEFIKILEKNKKLLDQSFTNYFKLFFNEDLLQRGGASKSINFVRIPRFGTPDSARMFYQNWINFLKNKNIENGCRVFTNVISLRTNMISPDIKKKLYPQWGKMKQKLISDYINMLEKILFKYGEEFGFFSSGICSKSNKLLPQFDYVEVMLTNFTIQKAFVVLLPDIILPFGDSELSSGEEIGNWFESQLRARLKKLPFPIEYVRKPKEILKFKEIQKIIK